MKIRPFKFIKTVSSNILYAGIGIFGSIWSKKKGHSKNIQTKTKHTITTDIIEKTISSDDHIETIEETIITDTTISITEELVSEDTLTGTTKEIIEIETIEETTSAGNNINIIEEEILQEENFETGQTIETEHIISTTEEFSRDNVHFREEFILTDIHMSKFETETEDGHPNLPNEFKYLKELIDYRLNNPSGTNTPRMPYLETWGFPIREFIYENKWTNNYDVLTLLLIGLAPHAIPDLFDHAIQEKLKTSGDFPEIGGVRGKNYRGFLPTGQTAVYLLAGDDLERRERVEQLFWSDKNFEKKKILWLEELPQGEPVMSGKIIMALDYVDLFLYGSTAPPHFSTSFPARRIETRLKLKDIVLNPEVESHYENLKDWIDYNDELQKLDTKKRFRNGFRVLFHGPAGTGKTLTANVLGNETKKKVYKIDLSMVVSKYIGETEKNLELLFARAEDKDWILFFDEADAIFGKRTSVRDAHDKYANQEVSYLLQRIEDYNGLVILATNMKNNIDAAFIRRFNDIVKFSIPNESERKEIWEKSFPENSDFDDIPNKVKKYELTGGNINNVIHYAGIQAVKRRSEMPKENAGPVLVSDCNHEDEDQDDPKKLKYYLEDVIEGISREMIKEGKPFQAMN